MEVVVADETQPLKAGSGDRHWLITGAAEDGLGFRLMRAKSPGGAPIHVPRHHHPFAQVRWAEKGPRSYGPDQFIPEGDIAYFPRAAYYGPELLNDQPDEYSTTLQFGFNAEYMPIGGEIPPLQKDGTRGWPNRENAPPIYAPTERHPTYKADQAVLEAMKGVEEDNWRPSKRAKPGQVTAHRTIPPESYDAVVLMHPKAQSYYQLSPGVEIKHLGRFFDHPGPNGDTRISQIRLSEGGVYHLSSDRAQIAWSSTPGLIADGRVCPAVTAVYSARDEEGAITGKDNTEVFIVEFPRLD